MVKIFFVLLVLVVLVSALAALLFAVLAMAVLAAMIAIPAYVFWRSWQARHRLAQPAHTSIEGLKRLYIEGKIDLFEFERRVERLIAVEV